VWTEHIQVLERPSTGGLSTGVPHRVREPRRSALPDLLREKKVGDPAEARITAALSCRT